MRDAAITVEITTRKRSFLRNPLYVTGGDNSPIIATMWRVKIAGIKGSLAVAGFRVWAEKHSALGKRLLNNPMARERVMAELPAGNAYEWIWF